MPDRIRDAVADGAWLQAMLDAEAALAAAEARVGVIPAEAATAIAAAARADRFDPAALGREGRAAGNPVVPLVRALTAAVPGDAAHYVHWGATSQDIIDTAAMLVARRALELVGEDMAAAAAACARLADRHRSTLMPGRTLLQHALPITFGLKAAGWLVGLVEARERLAGVRTSRLAAQLGGGSGTLAALGGDGVAVLRAFAEELELAEPPLPWHTMRVRVAELGGALAVAAGVLAKIALDVALLAQTEVGEVAEAPGDGRGRSSTMPHKRNPVASTLARACALRAHALTALLPLAMAQEHERAAGAWHAEWEAVRDALAATGGAAAWVRDAVEGLAVDAERMRANLDLTGGLELTERVMMALAPHMGRLEAHETVSAASARALSGGRPLRDELLADPVVREHLAEAEVDRVLDPAGYLGASEALVERALALYREAASEGRAARDGAR